MISMKPKDNPALSEERQAARRGGRTDTPRLISCGARATKIRRTDEKLSTGSSPATPTP